jgi:hypothetical protein
MSDNHIHPNRKFELDREAFKAWQDRTRKGIEHALKAANWIMLSAAIGAIAERTGSNWATAFYIIIIVLVAWYISTLASEVVSNLLNTKPFRRLTWEAENVVFAIFTIPIFLVTQWLVSLLSKLILTALK